MAKRKTINFRKLIMFLMIPTAIIFFLGYRFLKFSNSSDLQSLLQNLPKEITDSISLANSRQKENEEMFKKFEDLTKDLMEVNKKQNQQLADQKLVLQNKMNELREPPETATLREKLTWVYGYELKSKFPAYIWQTWPYSQYDDRMDVSLKKFYDNWHNKNPGFVHELINDDIMNLLVNHFYKAIPEVIETFNILPTQMLKADFFRFLILYAKGGTFADMDTDPIQPIPNWIPENVSPKEVGIIVNIEVDAQTKDWQEKYPRRLQFGTSVIQCKPRHPVIREVIATIIETTLKKRHDGEARMNLKEDMNIVKWTGSGSFTEILMKYFNDYIQSGILSKVTWKDFHNLEMPRLVGDVLVFPQFSFNAPRSFDNSDERKPLYFVSHERMKSWNGLDNIKNKNLEQKQEAAADAAADAAAEK
ncbi:hypothetical protein ACO0RG_002963 [Hanseniaspora osmophila]